MLRTIQLMFDYDNWATERLLEGMKGLRPEQYENTEASAHGSIRNTFAHLLGMQWSWFSWFSHRLPPEEAVMEKVSAEEIPDVGAAELRWRYVREQTEKTVRGLSQEAVVAEWEFEIPKGPIIRIPLWKMLLHVANHGTHTRAQIMAAIRRSGGSPLPGDLIHMLLGK